MNDIRESNIYNWTEADDIEEKRVAARDEKWRKEKQHDYFKSIIKWTLWKETEYPILVAEFQVAAKHEFKSKVGKKKTENVKDELTADLIKMLKELVV